MVPRVWESEALGSVWFISGVGLGFGFGIGFGFGVVLGERNYIYLNIFYNKF